MGFYYGQTSREVLIPLCFLCTGRHPQHRESPSCAALTIPWQLWEARPAPLYRQSLHPAQLHNSCVRQDVVCAAVLLRAGFTCVQALLTLPLTGSARGQVTSVPLQTHFFLKKIWGKQHTGPTRLCKHSGGSLLTCLEQTHWFQWELLF